MRYKRINGFHIEPDSMPDPLLLRAIAGPILIVTAAVPAAPVLSPDQIRRGADLAAIMDCAGCHTTGALTGAPVPQRHLAGAGDRACHVAFCTDRSPMTAHRHGARIARPEFTTSCPTRMRSLT